MAKKKKIYLVWQCSGSSEDYSERLCGVYDSDENAQKRRFISLKYRRYDDTSCEKHWG